MVIDLESSELQLHFAQLQSFLAAWSEQQQRIVQRFGEDSKLVAADTNADSLASAKDSHKPDKLDAPQEPHVSKKSNETETRNVMVCKGPPISSTSGHESVKKKSRISDVVDACDVDGACNDIPQRTTSSLSIPIRSTSSMFSVKEFIQQTQKSTKETLTTLTPEPKVFETMCAIVIMINAVTIAVTTDLQIRNPGDPTPKPLAALELAFTSFYTFEIGMRFRWEGWGYFRDPDKWRWNVFDIFLVAQAIWDQLQKYVVSTTAFANMSFLRLLRLMKTLKLLRMIRLLRSFRELRLILSSIMGCMRSIVWSFALIFVVSFMFAVVVLQGCVTYLDNASEDVPVSLRKAIDHNWSSTAHAMLTLFISAMGGEDWHIQGKLLKEVGWVYYGAYVTYISLFVFVISNTICSVFLEATMNHADKDHQLTVELQLERKHDYIAKLQVFFNEVDNDCNGEITFEEFCTHLDSPHLLAFADSLEIDISDAKLFFNIMSEQGKRPVDIETFVVGCIKIRGAARSMDLMHLAYSHTKSQKLVMDSFQKIENRMIAMERNIRQINQSPEPVIRRDDEDSALMINL